MATSLLLLALLLAGQASLAQTNVLKDVRLLSDTRRLEVQLAFHEPPRYHHRFEADERGRVIEVYLGR